MLRMLLPVFLTLTGHTVTIPISVRATMMALPASKDGVVVQVSVVQQDSKGAVLVAKHLVVNRREARTEFQVPPGRYIVKAEAAGLWAPDYAIHIAPGDTPAADLTLWATNDMTFEVVTEGHEPATELIVQFRGAPTAEERVRVPYGFATCKVLERRAICSVPAGKLDLRVMSAPSAQAFIPEFFWDVDNRLGGRAAPLRLALIKGASLIGYVRNEKGAPAVRASVELKTPGGMRIRSPASTGGSGPQDVGSDEQLSRLRATTNQRGFFQIRRPTPGEYLVVATGEDGTSSQRAVSLEVGRETALSDFLVLESPYQVEVTIDPPVHPAGDPWSIELLRIRPVTSVMRYTADHNGAAVLDGIGRGSYNITVHVGSEKYFLDAFEVEGQPGPLQIKIPLVSVKGKISLGGKPLRARLIFGGELGPRSVSLESSETGHFGGVLPRKGDWDVQIEASDPPVHRRLRRVSVVTGNSHEAEVDIQLQDARLKGRVVDDAGNLVGPALVNVTPVASAEDTVMQFRTDEAGTFELNGLSPGAILALQANTPDQRSSDIIAVTLGETESDATLVVAKPSELTGRVLSSASTRPLPGAKLLAMAANRPLTGAGVRTTDVEGRFSLRLPPKTVSATVGYWAEGYSLDYVQAQVGTDAETALFLSPVGGTLSVTLAEPTAMEGYLPVVVHRGAVLPPRALATMRPENRAVAPDSANPRVVVVPNLAPGEYVLCSMDSKAFYLGLSPSIGENCSSGVLSPGGELMLSLSEKQASQ